MKNLLKVEYRDVTATYICKNTLTYIRYASVHARIRAQKYVVYYTFQHTSTITKLSQVVTKYYKNITSLIGVNVRIQREKQVWTVQKVLTSYKRKTRESNRGRRRIGPQIGLPLILGCYSCTLWSTRSPPLSKFQDLDMQIQRSQNSPTSGVVNAKRRAGTTCIDKFVSNEHVLKIVSWVQHTGVSNEIASKINVVKPVVPYTKKIS